MSTRELEMATARPKWSDSDGENVGFGLTNVCVGTVGVAPLRSNTYTFAGMSRVSNSRLFPMTTNVPETETALPK